MHGAGEQQQYHYTRNDEQPSTSLQQHPGTHQMHQLAPHRLQGSVMRMPTMSASSTTPTTSRANLVPIGKPIKIGDNILQPAGTLVFSPGTGTTWPTGQRVLFKPNVVQANLFPIGPVITTSSTPNWYVNQPATTTTTSNSNNLNTVNGSSATPDSGIQSIPTSPPSPSHEMSHVQRYEEEEDDEPADFTDMPKLKPVDEDDCYDSPCTSSMGMNLSDDNSTPTTTTAMKAAPSTSSAPSKEEFGKMNTEEFVLSLSENVDLADAVERLIKFDPDKAKNIASLIKKHTDEEPKNQKKKKEMEAEVSSTTPTTPRSRGTRKRTKCTRNTNSPDVTTSTNILEEPSTSTSAEDLEAKTERKRRGRKPKKRNMKSEDEGGEDVKKVKHDTSRELALTPEPTTSSRPQSSMTAAATDPVQFRIRVREMMDRQLEQLTQRMSTDMTDMRISHAITNKTVIGGKRKESFVRQLAEQSKKLKKGQFGKRLRMFMTEEEIKLEEEDVKPKDVKEVKEEDVPKMRSRLPSRRTRVDESPEVLFDVEGKFNGEYYEIPKSVPSSDAVIPLWKAPSLTCGCTKGACTSDMDCLNRAMRVQCNSDCTLPYCANRRFWKEDSSKLFVSTGPRTKRVLKTKVVRRAGDFLCEYAGEVITSDEAVKRFEGSQDNRIVAISSQLFVDATVRGNVARFVKHSCKPNSRLEVWSVNGLYRTGIFALIDLGANVEITVDKSGLIPARRQCHCGAIGCKKVIRGVRRAVMSNEDDHVKSSLFLGRNYRKAMRHARRSSLPPILSTEEPSGSVNSVLQMKKVLAAFSFRIRNVDGTLERPMIPHYSSVCRFLKQSQPDPAEFIGLIRKWLTVIDDDDVERAFVAIVSQYLSPSLLTSAKKPKENAPRARAPSTSCQSPVPPKRVDVDLSYLEGQHAIGSYDPDEAWNTYRANASDNAVRCVCGALDEDGGMVQCDKCHFWLHIDCCTYDSAKTSEEKEYTCDFCVGNHSTHSPSADVILKTELDVRFSNCDYYRSLVNRRGIQVRLNETVYVNINLPQDHKALLRNLKEEKKGSKQSKEFDKSLWPQAPSDKIPPREFNRREARIFRVERLFVCPGNNRFVFGFFYIHPHETFADSGRLFHKKEVFATPYYETLPLDEVIGRCLVVDSATWSKGRPKVPKFKEDDVFLCEMQVGKNKRVFEKVPLKNRYPINTQAYVFTKFSQPKKVVRNFRPYDPANQPPKPPKTPTVQHQSPSSLAPSNSSPSLPDPKKERQKNINTVLERLRALKKKQ